MKIVFGTLNWAKAKVGSEEIVDVDRICYLCSIIKNDGGALFHVGNPQKKNEAQAEVRSHFCYDFSSVVACLTEFISLLQVLQTIIIPRFFAPHYITRFNPSKLDELEKTTITQLPLENTMKKYKAYKMTVHGLP